MNGVVSRNAWLIDRPPLFWVTIGIAVVGIITGVVAVVRRPKPTRLATGHVGRGQLQICEQCYRVHENDGPICLYCGEPVKR